MWAAHACSACHGENAAGNLGPNITPSRTFGIGAWNFKQFYSAVRYGLNGNGTNLCLAMARFSESDISEQGMRDLYEYLSSKPAVDVPNGGTACP